MESGSHLDEAEHLQFYEELLYNLLNEVSRCPARLNWEAVKGGSGLSYPSELLSNLC